MIESFKNFERLRYRLSNDMREIASSTKRNSNNAKNQVSNTIFATVFTSFVTEIAFKHDGNGYEIGKVLILLILFILVYIISYALYNYIYKALSNLWDAEKVHKLERGPHKIIQIQKDFDNIACDSVLVAKSYIDTYNSLQNNSSNQNLKIFYYYEVMHYLDTAAEKTEELLFYKEECIRTMRTALGVDIYRIRNLTNIMEEIQTFLDQEYHNICNNNVPEKDAIEYQYNQIKHKVNDIEDGLNSI